MSAFWWIPGLIPLIGALILFVSPAWPICKLEGVSSKYEAHENWIKFAIYFASNLLFSLLVSVICWMFATAKTKFPEVWDFQFVGIEHQMQWTEEESRTRQVYCGTDSKGNSIYRTETYYVTVKKGPYWYTHDEYGNRDRISEQTYGEWKLLWNNEISAGMHKGSSAGFDRKIDGPIFKCAWPQTFETIYPSTSIHKYVNKVRTSNSVLKWKEPTKELVKKYPRPADIGNTSPVAVYGGYSPNSKELLYLKRINASLGAKFQVHTILVLFDGKADMGVVEDVLSAWQGPNKNELVVFMSKDGDKVNWVDVQSWMDNTTIHGMIRDQIMAESFSIQRYGAIIKDNVRHTWHRKDFEELNNYIRVDINPVWIWVSVILSILFGIGMFFLIEKYLYSDFRYRM